MKKYKENGRFFYIIFCFVFAGCAHQISFHELDYEIASDRHNAGIVVVISRSTVEEQITIKSFMTGIAHNWNAMPGQMLKQVADIELPQLFQHYEFSYTYKEPSTGDPRLTLQLVVNHYDFSDFQASFSVRAIASGPDNKALFDKVYSEVGISQGGKMFWAGAFGMKSAIRQSSLDALKKIFKALRLDLIKVVTLESSSGIVNTE